MIHQWKFLVIEVCHDKVLPYINFHSETGECADGSPLPYIHTCTYTHTCVYARVSMCSDCNISNLLCNAPRKPYNRFSR